MSYPAYKIAKAAVRRGWPVFPCILTEGGRKIQIGNGRQVNLLMIVQEEAYELSCVQDREGGRSSWVAGVPLYPDGGRSEDSDRKRTTSEPIDDRTGGSV